MLTARRALERVEHTLGGTPAGAVGGFTLLNEAGYFLASMHQWNWLKSSRTILEGRADETATDWTYTHSTRTLNDAGAGGDLAGYTFLEGDRIAITGGTGVTADTEFEVESKTDDDTIILKSPGLGAAADSQSDIDFTLSPDAVELPSDFKRLIAIDTTESLVSGVHQCSIDYIMQLRTNEVVVTSTTDFWMALVHAGTPPKPRMELYPSLVTKDVNLFTLYYESDWAKIDGDEDLIRVPEWLEGFFLYLLSEWARGLEEEDQMPLEMRLERILQSTYFRRMKVRDGLEQPHVGEIAGGAVHMATNNYNTMLRSTVSAPSTL